MGSTPRLKMKEELNYRKGSTNESRNCGYCIHFRTMNSRRINGQTIGTVPRCWILGRELSKRYEVRRDYTCDKQVFNGTDFSKLVM